MKYARQKLQKIKQLPFQKRMIYIWDYYKAPIFLSVFIIIFFCYFLLPIFLNMGKNTVMSLAIIDSSQSAKTDTSELSAGLLSYLDGNSKKDIILIDTSGGTYDTSSSSTIKNAILLSSVGENDIVICNEELYHTYDSKGAFLDWDLLSDNLLPEASANISGTAYDLSSCPKWQKLSYTDYQPVYACIPVSCKHPERAIAFINYLYSTD